MMIALQSLISLAMILVILHLYNQYRVDRLRHALFQVRDELFDEARVGRIAFDSPAYQAVRSICNGMIRLGHTISISDSLIFSMITPPSRAEAATAAFEGAIATWTEAERAVAYPYLERANRCVVEHLATSPYVLITLLPPVTMYVLTRAGYDLAALAVKKLSKPLGSLDVVALREGRRQLSQEPSGSAFA